MSTHSKYQDCVDSKCQPQAIPTEAHSSVNTVYNNDSETLPPSNLSCLVKLVSPGDSFFIISQNTEKKMSEQNSWFLI